MTDANVTYDLVEQRSASDVLAVTASKINTEHEAAQQCAAAAVAHAIRCGELLIEAKAALPHGAFGAWLAANVEFSDRTARGYMQLAGLDEAKRQRVADMTLRGALAALAQPKTQPPARDEDEEYFLERLRAQGGCDTEAQWERTNSIQRRELARAAEALLAYSVEGFEHMSPDELRRATDVTKDCARMVQEMIEWPDSPAPSGAYRIRDVFVELQLHELQRDIGQLLHGLDRRGGDDASHDG